MSIKEEIGSRITKVRKEIGITIKELATRTGNLSAARISNWEQGTRSPGPLEAKLVANVLNVSASYLLCLTDNPQGEISLPTGNSSRYIPVIKMKDALIVKEQNSEIGSPVIFDKEKKSIVVDGFNNSSINPSLFAVIIEDISMQPDLNQGGLVIIDGDREPAPGDFVLAHLIEKKQNVLRRYGETESFLFQLLASNPLWTTIYVNKSDEVSIIGVVTEYRRYL